MLFRNIAINHNTEFTPVAILQCMLMFPFFNLNNPYQYANSFLFQLFKGYKDVFYDFLNDGRIDWRKIMWNIAVQIWNLIVLRSDHKRSQYPTVLIFDDTDIIKTSKKMELISKIHSHVDHSYHFGYKALFCCISDGVSQLIMNHALVRESKENSYGLSKQQESQMHVMQDKPDSPVIKRKEESSESKIKLMMDMIGRAIRQHVHFDYVLNDSWFTCEELV